MGFKNTIVTDLGQTVANLKKKVTTKHGWFGDYDYKFLFTPRIPFTKQGDNLVQPFFGLDSEMPIFLGMLLGLQHSLAMLAGIITPPIIISGIVSLDVTGQQYLVSASLIVCGILTTIQITRFHIFGTKYYLGTGLLSVVGTSFATITIVENAIPIMYNNGTCPVAADGTHLPCPEGYGAILGTGAVCALFEMLMSFIPPNALRKVFPPIVTGPVVVMIGVKLIASGFKDWLGGSNCMTTAVCPAFAGSDVHTAPWGSAEFIGLGFSVYVTIILCEKFGSPIMKSCAVIVGLLVGCIIAAACNYFDGSSIGKAPVANFMWVKTFKLSVYGPAVLPMLATYVVLMMEAIGDITATCDVSRLEVDGELYDSRIQGGVLADGFNGALACLMTVTPVSTFAQNNGVISITKCANRTAGYWCCFFLIVMGIFSKFAAAIVSIPKPVLGGMTTFLFTSVTVSGIAIIARAKLDRRDRFVLTTSLLFGFGATLVPNWFSIVFANTNANNSLRGFLDAITLVLESGFAICGIVGLIMNLIIKDEHEELKDENTTFLEGNDASVVQSESYEMGTSSSVDKEDSEVKMNKGSESV
jgi:NCS2 family nucleobase:cation symporter-2